MTASGSEEGDPLDDVRDIEREIGELRRELLLALTRAKDHFSLLAELEERGTATAEHLGVARTAAAELQAKIERRQVDLERARAQATVRELALAVERRDESALRTVEAIDGLAAALQDLDRRRARIARARSAVTSRGLEAEVSPEPEEFVDAVQRLVELTAGLPGWPTREQFEPQGVEAPADLSEAARRKRRTPAKRRSSG